MSASFLSAMNTRANHFAIDEENKRLKAELAMLLKEKEELKKTIVSAKVDAWRELQCHINPKFSTYETLSYIKELCEDEGFNISVVKEIFDECEHPYYYNIKKRRNYLFWLGHR